MHDDGDVDGVVDGEKAAGGRSFDTPAVVLVALNPKP